VVSILLVLLSLLLIAMPMVFSIKVNSAALLLVVLVVVVVAHHTHHTAQKLPIKHPTNPSNRNFLYEEIFSFLKAKVHFLLQLVYILGCQQSFGVFFKNFIFVFSLQKYN
jgi:hypothetical protein